jgi:hypothetical protein
VAKIQENIDHNKYHRGKICMPGLKVRPNIFLEAAAHVALVLWQVHHIWFGVTNTINGFNCFFIRP